MFTELYWQLGFVPGFYVGLSAGSLNAITLWVLGRKPRAQIAKILLFLIFMGVMYTFANKTSIEYDFLSFFMESTTAFIIYATMLPFLLYSFGSTLWAVLVKIGINIIISRVAADYARAQFPENGSGEWFMKSLLSAAIDGVWIGLSCASLALEWLVPLIYRKVKRYYFFARPYQLFFYHERNVRNTEARFCRTLACF